KVDVEEHPVGDDDQGFNTAVEQHLQITFEAAAFIVHVGENGKIRRLVESVLDAAEDHGSERVGHIEDHDADCVATLAAQRAGKLVGTVSEFLRGALYFFLGGGGDVAGQGR